MLTNLGGQNASLGFGFLKERSGFSINFSLIAFSESDSYARLLVAALLNTILVAIISIFFATILGLFIGILRLSSNWLVRNIAGAYIEFFRNVPLLLQILFWYIGVLRNLPLPRQSISIFDSIFVHKRGISLPALIFEGNAAFWWAGAIITSVLVGIGLWIWSKNRQNKTGKVFAFWRVTIFVSLAIITLCYFAGGHQFELDIPHLQGFNFKGGMRCTPELVAIVFSLSMYTAAFIAEIMRAGILSVKKGQSEAASSLGLTRRQSLRLIILPQALRVIIPPLASQYLNLTKNSSLGAAIAFPDLVGAFAGTALNQTGKAVEIIFITMMIYLGLSLTVSLIMNFYNRRINRTRQ